MLTYNSYKKMAYHMMAIIVNEDFIDPIGEVYRVCHPRDPKCDKWHQKTAQQFRQVHNSFHHKSIAKVQNSVLMDNIAHCEENYWNHSIGRLVVNVYHNRAETYRLIPFLSVQHYQDQQIHTCPKASPINVGIVVAPDHWAEDHY
jgi:hypothetical protein